MLDRTHAELVLFTRAPGTQTAGITGLRPGSLTETLKKHEVSRRLSQRHFCCSCFQNSLPARRHVPSVGHVVRSYADTRGLLSRGPSVPQHQAEKSERRSPCWPVRGFQKRTQEDLVLLSPWCPHPLPAPMPHPPHAHSSLLMGKEHGRAPSVLSLHEAGGATHKAAGRPQGHCRPELPCPVSPLAGLVLQPCALHLYPPTWCLGATCSLPPSPP